MKTRKELKDKIEKAFADDKKISQAMNLAVQEALQKHKAAGNRIAVWENGKAVWIDPNKI